MDGGDIKSQCDRYIGRLDTLGEMLGLLHKNGAEFNDAVQKVDASHGEQRRMAALTEFVQTSYLGIERIKNWAIDAQREAEDELILLKLKLDELGRPK